MKGLSNETDFYKKGFKRSKHCEHTIIKSIWWGQLKKTAIFEKIPSTKFWIIYKSKFDQKYLENEKRFWHAVFFWWLVLFLYLYLLILNKAYDINCLRGTRVPRQYTVQQFTQFLKLAPCAISCSTQLYDQLCSHDKVAHPQQSLEICPVPSWNWVFQSLSDFGCARGGRWRAEVR